MRDGNRKIPVPMIMLVIAAPSPHGDRARIRPRSRSCASIAMVITPPKTSSLADIRGLGKSG